MRTGFTYVMSDIHGNTERFNSVMKQINLRPEDTLYVLGDVADRYPDGIRILRKLMKMPNVRMLLGNHDFMMLDALYYNADCPKDAERLKDALSKIDDSILFLESSIGPVIGSHVGPGMIAVVFWGGDKREQLSVADRIARRVKQG